MADQSERSTTAAVPGAHASPASRDSTRILLRLYVAGDSPNSTLAVANLNTVLSTLGDQPNQPTLEVVDVFRSPMNALADRIVVTPTLLIVGAEATNVVLGDLTDLMKIAAIIQNAVDRS